MSLPYDMGNEGDLLKHGVLAESVRWQCERNGSLRFTGLHVTTSEASRSRPLRVHPVRHRSEQGVEGRSGHPGIPFLHPIAESGIARLHSGKCGPAAV